MVVEIAAHKSQAHQFNPDKDHFPGDQAFFRVAEREAGVGLVDGDGTIIGSYRGLDGLDAALAALRQRQG